MPSTDVTVYAWFVDPTVTVDFGEGHEGFVDNYKDQTGSTDQGTNIPFKVDGTKVTYTLTPDSKIDDALVVIQSFSSRIQFQADFLDNGVYFMNDYGITADTADRYEDKKAYDAEWRAKGNDPIPGAGVTLHALWAQPTDDVSITVEPLVCGTEVGVSGSGTALVRSDPVPRFAVSGNAAIDFAGAQDWCATKDRNDLFQGNAQGGTDYYAWALAKPSFGYFFKDIDTTVTVTNDPDAAVQIDGNGPDAKNYGERITVFAKVTATHKGEWTQTKAPTCTEKGVKERTCANEECKAHETADVDPLDHDWGEWKQTKAPTCTEKGTDERVCTRDSSHKETREVAVDPTAHNWGEPTYTWSGDNATCTATRSCRNDAGHVETEVAQATSTVTREPTATEAGTRTYTATFSNEAFATRTKDVEIPATGEGDAGATYTAVAGANVTWTKGSGTDATVTIKRTEDDGTTFAHFSGITMDGKEVPADQYRKQPGSVVITLPAAYLETLSVGEHALVAKFDDGSVATKLTVQAAATPTPTDPDADPTDPDADPTKPSTDPSKPSTDPANPNNTGTSTTPKAHATPTTSTPKTALPKTADESSAPLAASLVGVAALCFLAARGVKRA